MIVQLYDQQQGSTTEAFFEEIAISCRSQNRSLLQPHAESGSCVVLSSKGTLSRMSEPLFRGTSRQ
jgi:hypothetical protein